MVVAAETQVVAKTGGNVRLGQPFANAIRTISLLVPFATLWVFSPNRLQILRPAQFLIMGHKRYAPKQRGCRDDPVGWVSRECISELTSTLGNVVREGFDAIFREQPHLGDPFRRGNLETQAAAALECGDFEDGNAGNQKLVPFAMLREGLTRLARELLGVSIHPPHQDVGIQDDH